MKIGVIGTGNMGSVITLKLIKAGHEIFMANLLGRDSLYEFAAWSGAAACDIEDAVKDMDIVIISIPYKNIPDLPSRLFENVTKDTIIIDTGNYYPVLRDDTIELVESGMLESEWVEGFIGRSVVKAFNDISAEGLKNLGNGAVPLNERVTLSISGDNQYDKDQVKKIIEDLGFSTYDHGMMYNSWKQQPGSPLYFRNFSRQHFLEALKSLPDFYTKETQHLFADRRDWDGKVY